MSLLRTLFISAATALALSFSAGCNQTEDAGEAESAQTITIADAHGKALRVTVLFSERTETGSYAQVRVAGRSFTLSQWVDADSGALHSVVSADDAVLRYEYITDAAGAKLVVTDESGKRQLNAGDAMGSINEDAAALLLNFRQGGAAGETGYTYQTYCVGYDTSNPADWHLTVGACTCDHWYSVVCTMN
jgi:hypothetical protein